MRRRPAAALSIAALATLILLAAPDAAVASCLPPPPLDQAIKAADIVFVGTVTSTTNANRWATVAVTDVWRGPDQQATVVVKGGPDANAASSIDRSFETGVTYLFVPFLDPGGGLSDTSCSPTTPWSEAMVAFRPADAREPIGAAPQASGFDFGGLVAPIGVALVVAFALLLVGLAARGRQDG